MKYLITLLLMILPSSVFADAYPQGGGLPLPWPFPWAEECPVDWKGMAGRYLLSDSQSDEQIDLKVSVVTTHGFRIVRLSQFDRFGRLVAEGFSFVTKRNKLLRLKLMPRDRDQEAYWAMIKMHHTGYNPGCAVEQLVPILTLEKEGSPSGQSYYRLIRIHPDDN